MKGSVQAKSKAPVACDWAQVLENGALKVRLLPREDISGLQIEYKLKAGTRVVETRPASGALEASFDLEAFGDYHVRVLFSRKGDFSKKKTYIHKFSTEAVAYDENAAFLSLDLSAPGYEQGLMRIMRLRVEKETHDQEMDALMDKLQQLAAMGGSLSQYLREQGVHQVSLYCEEADWPLARPICHDLQTQADIQVVRYLSSKDFAKKYTWAYTPGPEFVGVTPEILDTIGPEDVLLVISSTLSSAMDNAVRSSTAPRLIYLSKVLNDLVYHYTYEKPLAEFVADHPNVSVITFKFPKYPEKGTWSENEAKMVEGNWQRTKVIRSLREGGNYIPAAYDNMGYTPDDIMEMYRTYPQYVNEKGYASLLDNTGKLVNIVGGNRVTTDVPDEYNRTVFFVGGCQVLGMGSEDKDTLSSAFQRLLNEVYPNTFCVVNCGAYCSKRKVFVTHTLKSLPCSPGDVVVIQSDRAPHVEGVVSYDFSRLFMRPHAYGEVFLDYHVKKKHAHRSPRGHAVLAQSLFARMAEDNAFEAPAYAKEDTPEVAKTMPQVKKASLPSPYAKELQAYKDFLRTKKRTGEGTVGAIVMNCNPFTLGHRYLIEYASGQVDTLYIFVVQEDKSFFPFADRLALVEKGTEDLGNVIVIPSGKFIISSITFSDYFAKQALADRVIDSSNDVTLFAEEIAPVLGITTRFVGEEPLCNVTRQYNNTMRRILPEYGIDLVIIPRKEMGGEPISASRVRALLDEKRFDEISVIVPETTLDYLVGRFG